MFKLLKGLIAFVLVVVVVAGIGLVVVANMTPRDLNLTQVSIGGKTIEELGLADTKIKDIFKSFNSLSDNKDVVDNPYDQATEEQSASDAMAGSSIENEENYLPLLDGKVTYDKQYLKVYQDKTLAYIFNNIVTSASNQDGTLEELRNLNVTIEQMSINVVDGKPSLNVIGKFSIVQFKQQIVEQLGVLASFVKIPDYLYIKVDFDVAVDSLGMMTLASTGYSINGQEDDPVIKALLEVVQSADSSFNIQSVVEKLALGISSVVGNLGRIASATMGADGTASDIVYGVSGIGDGSLSVVTYTHIEGILP